MKKYHPRRSAHHLTGKSNYKRDKQRRAKRPGRRKSASGRIYYERRRNRADVNPRKHY